MILDIEKIRRDTPHCTDKLFLNSAGSSLMPTAVTGSIISYLRDEEKIGGYKLREDRQEEISNFYNQASLLLNCHPRNIAFSHDATDAYTKALSSIDFRAGDVIITSDDDYVSNHINFISLQKRYGVNIIRSKNLENGDIDFNHFEKLIKSHNPKLVSITHIPTNSGLIQDVVSVGSICKKYNILYLLDACQSVGQIQVDVQKIQCDFLSATGRKFVRGPRGSGLLFVSDRLLEKGFVPLFIDLHGATWTDEHDYKIIKNASRFEMWEKPYALMVGLKEALKYINITGMDKIELYNQDLMQHLRSNLRLIPKLKMFDQGSKTGNILSFQKSGKSLSHTKQVLDQHKVYYSVVQKKGALIDFTKKGIDWAIRLSPHYFNTKVEMDTISEIINEI